MYAIARKSYAQNVFYYTKNQRKEKQYPPTKNSVAEHRVTKSLNVNTC